MRLLNLQILIQDTITFGLCFMSWGAIVGFHFIISAVIGALVGIAVFIFARKPNYGGVKSISTIGGMGSFFATVGLIIWAIKAFI